MALALFFSKTTIQYHAIRHKEDNEHREDGTCLAYAGSELSFLLNYLRRKNDSRGKKE